MLLLSILPHLLLPIVYCFGWLVEFHETLGTGGLWLGMFTFFMINRFLLSPILNSSISMTGSDYVKNQRSRRKAQKRSS